MEVDTDGEKNERRIKETEIFPMGGGEATTSEKMESLYAFIR